MSHRQTDIRNALVSLLTGTAPTYATGAQDRIYKNKTHNYQQAKLPAITVRDGSETSVPKSTTSTQYIRTWSVRVEIVADGNVNVDEALDTIAKQVEDLINSNRSLGGLATTISYTGSEVEFDGSGSKTIAAKTLNLNIQYTY